MNLEEIRDYCLAKKGTTEDFPFDEDTLVFKVMGKMFLLVGLKKWEAGDKSINLKCDPERALELREQYPDTIVGGYHMSKKHWNTVMTNDGVLSRKELQSQIDHSYDSVIATFTKKQKEAFKLL